MVNAGQPQVVVLNGPAGVGKSTVGRRLAATAANGVCVCGDDLKHFVVTREPGTVGLGMSYAAGAALADVFLAGGYDLVVFEFVFRSRAPVERFRTSLRADVAVHLLTLWAPLDTVRHREALRAGRERLGDAVTTCWEEMAGNLAELGRVVDAHGPLDDVLADVCHHVKSGTAEL